jgi:hypothetical protein
MASKKMENRLWLKSGSLKDCNRGIFVSNSWCKSTVAYPKILWPDVFQNLEFFVFYNGNKVHVPYVGVWGSTSL